MLEQIGSSASIIALLVGTANWIRQRLTKGGIRIETAIERGPVTRQSGFTEPAVKITVVNEGGHPVKIRDVRLMICRDYGAPVAAEAPPERFHTELPFDLQPGADESWYIPAEKLANLLHALHRPLTTTASSSRMVALHARCIDGGGKGYKSRAFQFSVDQNAHSYM